MNKTFYGHTPNVNGLLNNQIFSSIYLGAHMNNYTHFFRHLSIDLLIAQADTHIFKDNME